MVRFLFSTRSFLGSMLLLSLLTACQKDEAILINTTEVSATFPEVDERLWSHFEAFEAEAAERGISIDLAVAGITGVIESIAEQHVAGRCNYSQVLPGLVTVDKEFWERSAPIYREFIVFHELGHCYLHLDHREEVDQNGICLSLMRSGLEDCRDNYNLGTREAYLDELFGAMEN